MASPANAASPAGSSTGAPIDPQNNALVSAWQRLMADKNNPQVRAWLPALGNMLKAGSISQDQLHAFVQRLVSGQPLGPPPPMPSTSAAPAQPTPPSQPVAQPTPTPQPQAPQVSSTGEPLLSSDPILTNYPTIPAITDANPGAVQWPISQQGRPTLTGGNVGGRIAGTPSLVTRPGDDGSMFASDDSRRNRKNTPGEQSMRRSIQDLVSSIDPNVKIEPEVEDLLLEIADEFIDSVTNFSCRLAKHRGGDILEVRDLQLHLERNHNIRIPGFASDETRLSLAQTSVAPTAPAAPAKKTGTGTHMTLRSHRLAQVQQAKREGKLL